MKKRFIFVLFLIVFVLIVTNIYTVSAYIFNDNGKMARLKFTVVDFDGNTPVSGAIVCIPETGKYYYTDSSGNTPIIEVSIVTDAYYDNICKRNFGEITVIVYKEGYADYILCNLCVKENQNRTNIKLLIYKQYEGMPDFTPIVETPDETWLKELIEKYKKK